MRQITESESTPQADGFYMPAEFAPQERVWMGWPNRPDTFAFGAVPAQRTYAGIANAISEFTPVDVGSVPNVGVAIRSARAAAGRPRRSNHPQNRAYSKPSSTPPS